MHRMIVTVTWLVGLFFSLLVLASEWKEWRLPDNQQGYSPRSRSTIPTACTQASSASTAGFAIPLRTRAGTREFLPLMSA